MRSLAEIAYETRQQREYAEHIRRQEDLARQASDPWAMVRREIDALQQENSELRHRLEQVERRVAMQVSQAGGDQ